MLNPSEDGEVGDVGLVNEVTPPLESICEKFCCLSVCKDYALKVCYHLFFLSLSSFAEILM